MDSISLQDLQVKMDEFLDEELTVDLSVQELLAILGSLDVTVTTYQNYQPIPGQEQLVSQHLQLLWTLEQRLRSKATWMLHEHSEVDDDE